MAKSTTVYVATDGDDAYDGSTVAFAVRTPARAIVLLAGRMGVIQMLACALNSSGAEIFFDPGPTGIVTVEGQLLLGDGYGTKIDGSKVTANAGNSVVTLSGSRSHARDFAVMLTPAGSTGVRMTWRAGLASNENSSLENLFVSASGVNCTAYGIGDDSSNDCSAWRIRSCDSVGNAVSSTGFVIGNGATGNVLDGLIDACNVQAHKYGVIYNGGSCECRDVDMQVISELAYWFRQSPVGVAVVDGGRIEGAKRLLKSTFGAQATAIPAIRNVVSVNQSNADGEGIQLSAAQPFSIDKVTMAGQSCPQIVALTGTVDGPSNAIISVRDLATDHIEPFRSPWSRPGKILRATGTQFMGYPGFQNYARRTSSCRTRRFNITTLVPVITILPSDSFDAAEIRLAHDGIAKLMPGTEIGQTLSLTIEQDGVGGRVCAWPCMVDTAASLASHARSRVAIEWTGNFWAQVSPVIVSVPPAPIATPFTADFTTGMPFWLGPSWEHLSGGGSLGVRGGVCICNSIGLVGDANGSDTVALFAPGAAAVVETGNPLATISVTLDWQPQDAVIAHYVDDQNFMALFLFNAWGRGNVGVSTYERGESQLYGVWNAGSEFVLAAPRTFVVQCTATGFNLSLDGVSLGSVTLTAAQIANHVSATKHGIILTNTSSKLLALSAI